MSGEIVLLTATVDPGQTQYLALKEPQKRLFEYLCSLVAWITLTKVRVIVFCENSGSSFDFGRLKNFAAKHGKTLEVLVYNENLSAAKFGKGYGEGEIIAYALRHSAHLKSNTPFYKVTGRTFLPYFDQILQAHRGKEIVFDFSATASPFLLIRNYKSLKSKHLGHVFLWSFKILLRLLWANLRLVFRRGVVCTLLNPLFVAVNSRIFKATTDYYRSHLQHSHTRVDDAQGYFLEHCLFEDLDMQYINVKSLDFQDVVGRSGSNGNWISQHRFSDEVIKIATDLLLDHESLRVQESRITEPHSNSNEAALGFT